MLLKESEARLLAVIGSHPELTTMDLVEDMRGEISKQHVYLLLGRLEESGLVSACLEATGRLGPPHRILSLTPRGRRVRNLALKLAAELELEICSRDVAMSGV